MKKKVSKVGKVSKVPKAFDTSGTFPSFGTSPSGFTLIKHSEVSSKGFTLIEILVGLTIVALLFGVGYAGYRDFARRQTLNSSYDKIRSLLSLAQQLALSGEKPAGCSGVLNGYRVNFDEKKFYAECVSSGTTSRVQERIIDIPAGIEILSSQPTILYKVLGQGTDQSSETTVTIRQTATGNAINAILTQDGRLKK